MTQRTGPAWHRDRVRQLERRRKYSTTLGDELAQCLGNGIDYEAEDLTFHPHANDNADTLFRTVTGFGSLPYMGKVNKRDNW